MRDDLKGSWQGATVVCLASGPSVTYEDCQRILAWRLGGVGRYVIVTNSMVFMAPWADAIFAMDSAWWRHYTSQLEAFTGLRLTCASTAPNTRRLKLDVSGNSGLASMMAAKYLGASRLILVGHDSTRGESGQAHCHADHPKPLTNIRSLPRWLGQYDRARCHFDGMNVVNTNPKTKIKLWPYVALNEALAA